MATIFIANRRIAFRKEAVGVSDAAREAASLTPEQTENATEPRQKAAEE